MVSSRGRHVRTLALFFLAVFRFTSIQASGAERAGAKLDRILSVRARQLTGRSRVMVEYRGAPDVRAITSAHGVAARTMRGRPTQVAEINNLDLLTLANDPRVSRVMADRPAFALLERTAAAIGITPTGMPATDVVETGLGFECRSGCGRRSGGTAPRTRGAAKGSDPFAPFLSSRRTNTPGLNVGA